MIDDGPGHVVRWVLLEDSIQHGVSNDFSGPGPESLVACVRAEDAVGFCNKSTIRG